MNNSILSVTHSAQRKLVEMAVDAALSKVNKERE